MIKKPQIVAVTLFCLLAVILLSIGINKPFNCHHDDNNWYYGQVADNYIHYGILNLKFGQLIPGQIPNSREFYTHHPPLLSIYLAGTIELLGDHYWTIRLVPIVFSIVTLIMFYLLLRQFYPTISALFSLAFWLVTPMFLFFGKMADHEAPTLFFIIFCLFFYVRWKKGGKRINFSLILIGLFLGQWTGWPTYYLAGSLFLLTWRWEILVLSLINFLLFLFHIYLLTGSVIGGGLAEILLFRMGLINRLSWVEENYTTRQLVSQEVSWLYHFFTPPQFVISLLALVTSTYRWLRKRKIDQQSVIWLIFLFVASAHVILFRTGAWRHDYWLYYFLPFFSWGVSQSLTILLKAVSLPKSVFIYAVYLVLLFLAIYQSQPFFWALQNMVVK